MTRPQFESRISLGNILTILALIFSVAGSWAAMNERQKMADERQRVADARLQKLENRVQVVEIEAARTDERLIAILQSLARIEAKLQRTEQ